MKRTNYHALKVCIIVFVFASLVFTIFNVHFLYKFPKQDNAVYATPLNLIELPIDIPVNNNNDDDPIFIDTPRGKLETSLIPSLQNYLSKYIKSHGNPIATLILIDTNSSQILALVQGRDPQQWGSNVHTSLYPHFPAASIFKIIVASAVLELTNLDPDINLSLMGGCGDVRPTGIWLIDQTVNYKTQMNLHRAFGLSCNSFFAKLAINYIGLNAIKDYAYNFGWEKPVPADFKTQESPLYAPSVENSSIYSIGRFAAGFGKVGLSAIHAAWIINSIANKGLAYPLHLFKKDSSLNQSINEFLSLQQHSKRILSEEAANNLIAIMDHTVTQGTARGTFRKGKYRFLSNELGGKTGTLKSTNPQGIATWFVGLMPLSNPKIAIVSLVILDELWHIKATDLAAEALWKYQQIQKELKKKLALQSGQTQNADNADQALQ